MGKASKQKKSTVKVIEKEVENVQSTNLVPPKLDKENIGIVNVVDFNYNVDLYVKLYLWLYLSVKKNYKFRKKKITFRFEDGNLVTMKVRTAIVNLIFWKPYCDFGKSITMDKLFDTKYVSEDTIAERCDNIITEFKEYGITIKQMRKTIRHIIESLSSISVNFCTKIGNTINMRDIIDLANENPRFDELIHTHYDEDNMPPLQEVEKDIMMKNDEAAAIIRSTPHSAINPFLCAGGNVNLGQMSQCLICIGPRSDIYGNISPVIVNTNFIMGLRNVSDYYLESFSQRKALIANRYQMCDSGYTSRQIDLATIDSCLVDVDDCGQDQTIEFYIPDEKTLKMMEYKYIETGRNKKGEPFYHVINPSTDKSLVGTTVKLRSHTICSLPQGQYCKKCYGELSYVVLGFQTNLLASHSLTEPVSQTVLSTKHLNKTRTKIVNWSDDIKHFFKTESEGLFIKPEYCSKEMKIGFYTEDIEEYLNMLTEGNSSDDDEEESEGPGDVMLDYVTRFVLSNGTDTHAFDNIDTELYINQEFLQKVLKSNEIDDGIIYVSLYGQHEDEPIFDVNIENIEISQFLKRIMALLGVKSKTTYTTISDILQRVVAAIIEINVKINFAHIESILYNMIRMPGFIIRRPDFREKNPEYMIIPTNKSIIYSRSLTTSLSFERISQQFKDVYTYLKTDEGFLDPFFR